VKRFVQPPRISSPCYMRTNNKRNLSQLILPYLNLDIKYYDLGLESRDAVRPRNSFTHVREPTPFPHLP